MNEEFGEIEIDKMTLGEIEEFEALVDLPISRAFDDDIPKGKVFRALAYLFNKREDPTYTYEQTANITFKLGEVKTVDTPLTTGSEDD